MTPRGLDRNVVTQRLLAMRRFLDQLDQLRLPADDPFGDYGEQVQVERIVGALVDLAAAVNTHVSLTVLRRVPPNMKLSFGAAAEAGAIDRDLAAGLAESVGLRNVLIHAYLELDLDVLARAVPKAREQYGAYIVQVARWLRDQPAE